MARLSDSKTCSQCNFKPKLVRGHAGKKNGDMRENNCLPQRHN